MDIKESLLEASTHPPQDCKTKLLIYSWLVGLGSIGSFSLLVYTFWQAAHL